MAVRWKCPTCGTGRNAPERMGATDTRRFCLPCSAKAPQLVAMVSPTLEKRRAAAQEKTAARVRAMNQRRADEKLAAITASGVNVPDEIKRLWNLPTARRQRRRLGFRLRSAAPAVTIDRRTDGSYSGHAKIGQHLIHLSLSPGLSREKVLVVIAHEVAHILCNESTHDESFVAMLSDLLREGHGVDVPMAAMDTDAPSWHLRAYRFDGVAIGMLREHLASTTT